MNDSLAFLADWGNAELDFAAPGASTHVIIAALIVEKTQLSQLEQLLAPLEQRFSQVAGDPAASGDAARWLPLLDALLAAPVQLVALLVDKRELGAQGLSRHQDSLYKFLFSLADRELTQRFPNLSLVGAAPGLGGFLGGFAQYIQQRHVPTLFEPARFRFVNAPASLLQPAARLVARSLAACYDQTLRLPDQTKASLHQRLTPQRLVLMHWPDRFTPLSAPALPGGPATYDPRLAELCVSLAQQVIHRRQLSDSPQAIDQVRCLQYLLFHFRHVDPARYIASRELMAHLEQRRGQPPTLHYFQVRIIAPLRDAGALIASSSQGYKIPACRQDLDDFIDHSNTIIQPLLARIGKCRDRIYLATDGELDILDRAAYAPLQQLLAGQRAGEPGEKVDL